LRFAKSSGKSLKEIDDALSKGKDLKREIPA